MNVGMSRAMRRIDLVMLVTLATGACGGAPAGPRYVLTVAAGNAQSDTIGKILPIPYAVLVTDAGGTPAVGVDVLWTVTGGGGSITPSSSTTDGAGIASAVRTLGATVGTATARAEVGGASVNFTATALPGQLVVLVTTLPIPENYGIHDQFIRDGLAFVCAWNSGVIIYDVGNGVKGGSPANPMLVDSITTAGGEVHNAWWFHSPAGEKKYLFIGQEGPGTIGAASSGDIHVVDVSDLNAIHEVAFFHLANAGTHNFWMDESNQILYAAYYNGGVVAIDVSGTLTGDISSRMIDSLSFGAGNTFTWGVQLYNGSLYASDMVSGLWQLSTANGLLSVVAGGNNLTERYGSDLWVANGYAYTGTWGFRSTYGNAVKVWRLDAAGAPAVVDSIVTPDIVTVSDIEVSDDGKVLMFSTENGPNSGFWFYSLSDPAHPALLGSYLVGGTSSGIHTATFSRINNRLYVFGAKDPSGAALVILDVTSLDQ